MRKRWNIKADYCGAGDAIVAAWVAEGANAAGYDVRFCAGGRNEEILRFFGQRLADERNGLNWDGRWKTPAEQLCGVNTDPWHVISQVMLPWRAEPVRPTPVIPPDAAEWAWNTANRPRAQSEDGPLVLLFPGACYNSRIWPSHYWLRLAWALRAAGYNTVTLDSSFAKLGHYPFQATTTWSNAAALISMADLVICNESGPGHVSGTLGTRTLVLCGPSPVRTILGQYESVEAVHVSSSEVECVGCNWDNGRGYNVGCNDQCIALMRLPWERVFKRATDILAPVELAGSIAEGSD